MQSESYHSYTLWGHAILQQEDILQPARYAESGTITQRNRLVESSGVLGYFDTENEAQGGRIELGQNMGRQPRLF